MTMTDPIADMLARIRNAGMARHPELVLPASNTKLAIARVLVEGGFLEEARIEAREGRAVLVLRVRYGDDGQPLVDGLQARVAAGTPRLRRPRRDSARSRRARRRRHLDVEGHPLRPRGTRSRDRRRSALRGVVRCRASDAR